MNPGKLSKKVINLISKPSNYEELLLSAISPWEFCKLVEKGRLLLNGSAQKWLEEAFDLPKMRLVPLTPIIAYESTNLIQPIQSDSADQIILATSKIENAHIITKDKLLHEYKHVKTIW